MPLARSRWASRRRNRPLSAILGAEPAAHNRPELDARTVASGLFGRIEPLAKARIFQGVTGVIVVMKSHATEDDIHNVVQLVEQLEYRAHVIRGIERTVVACVGEERGEAHSLQHLESVSGVERVMPVLRSFKLASREVRPEGSRINVGGVEIGGPRLAVIAGPCAVESEIQVNGAADAVKRAGAHLMRGGAYKPRTSPYAFQGLGEEGLRILARVRAETGLPVVSGAADIE